MIGLGRSRVRLRIDVHATHPPQPDSLRLRLAGSALRNQLRSIRHRLAEWARGVGMVGDDIEDLVLATYEALANVVDHAYPGQEGEAWLSAVCDGHGVDVTVGDSGTWRPPPAEPGLRGRGLHMISSLSQRASVDRTAAGTVVTMHWCLGQTHPGDSARCPRSNR